MSVVLIGGVEASRHCLEALAADAVPVSLVVGYPEGLAGRSAYVSMRQACARHSLPLLEIADVNSPVVHAAVRSSGGQLLLVTGWSQLLGRPLLDLCPLGAVGLHPTALPEGRGRAPIPWTLIKGLKSSAVTLFHLTAGVDDGDIVGQIRFDVSDDDAAAGLYAKVCGRYQELVRRFVPMLLAGTAPRTPQDHSRATWWPRRRPEDGRIDWSKGAAELHNWVRGLTHPYPGAFTNARGQRLVIWNSRRTADRTAAPDDGRDCGHVTAAGPEGISVLCGDGRRLVLLRVSFDDGLEIEASAAAELGLVAVGDALGGYP